MSTTNNTTVTTTNNNNNNSLADLVRRAYRNTHERLGFVLDGAFAKHGNVPGAAGSRFVGDRCTTQGGTEHMLFADMAAKWTEVFSDGDNTLILKAPLFEGVHAVLNAGALADLDPETPCHVKALGHHPTLVTAGQPRPTGVVTCVIEIDAGKDPDLKDFPDLRGEPIIATWFPGPSLPPSRPHDCAVGDELTAAEAIQKGWRTVCFE